MQLGGHIYIGKNNRVLEFDSRIRYLHLDQWLNHLCLKLTFGLRKDYFTEKTIEDISSYFTQAKYDGLTSEEYQKVLETEFISFFENYTKDSQIKRNADELREEARMKEYLSPFERRKINRP